MVDCFCGRWTLKENKCFDEFLVYYQYPWYKRTIAQMASIDLVITDKTENGVPSLKRDILSSFYTKSEVYIFDGEERENDEHFFKVHTITPEGTIHSKITNGDDIVFTDVIAVKDNILTVTKTWNDGTTTEDKVCVQTFTRVD